MKRTDGPFIIYELLPGQLYQRGKLHSLPTDKKAEGLEYYGITHSVALAPNTPDLDLVRWDVEGSHRYSHFPIPDGLLKQDQYLSRFAKELAAQIEEGEVVLTMCNAGRNRSGLLSALIIRELTGIPGSEAIKVVREHRPNSLVNPHFNRFLRSLS